MEFLNCLAMKSFLYLAFIALSFSTLTSCLSPKTLIDDDVYVVKNSALPVGESLNDESSYSSYRYKRDNNLLNSSVYMTDQFYQSMFYKNSFYGYGRDNYWNRLQFYDYGFSYAFLGNSYLGYYGTLGYLYSLGNNFNNGFYASTGYLASPEFSKSFSGPRFSFGGYCNQFSRSYSSGLKSVASNNGKIPVVVAGQSNHVNYPIGSQTNYNDRTSANNNSIESKRNYKPTYRGNLRTQQSGQSNNTQTLHPNNTISSGRNQGSRNQGTNISSPRGSGTTSKPVNGGNKHITTGRRN